MKNLSLSNITSAVEGQLFVYTRQGYVPAGTTGDELPAEEAACVVIDSRKLEKGGIFIATKGERVDGHDFIEDVFKAGALGVICEKLPEVTVDPDTAGQMPCIVVEDSFTALKKLAAFYRSAMSHVRIVGIVGSVGKTSTKEFVASVLAQKFSVLKTEGNFNNEVGVPLTLLRIRDEHNVAVVEMGINRFGEMDRLGAMVKPDGVVFTNVGPCHLEFLGDLDGVLRAKSEVFSHIRAGGFLCLNNEDEKLRGVKDVQGIKLLHYGEGGDSQAVDATSKGLLGTDFTLSLRKGDEEQQFGVTVSLPGVHMVMNALAAALVGVQFGMESDAIAAGIASTGAVGGRSNIIKTDSYCIVDDCYNANPRSMKAAIDLLCCADSRKVAILGDMFELGGDEAKLHAEIGGYAARKKVGLLICIGSLARHIFDGYKDHNGLTGCVHYDDVDSFLESFDFGELEDSDTILVKASHGMNFTRIVEALKQKSGRH